MIKRQQEDVSDNRTDGQTEKENVQENKKEKTY